MIYGTCTWQWLFFPFSLVVGSSRRLLGAIHGGQHGIWAWEGSFIYTHKEGYVRCCILLHSRSFEKKGGLGKIFRELRGLVASEQTGLEYEDLTWLAGRRDRREGG
ncbi:hypothetical protein F5882DRAFT_159280 [Hyaloscypha sp. PMI_1271]|nr:hypothetical protein F5882DRAFT_159280 [Hyaloscypha sp. PMI_1271]